MNVKPIDEQMLVKTLPGFDALTEDELHRIQVNSFEYPDFTALTTVSLRFVYLTPANREIELCFELSGNRSER